MARMVVDKVPRISSKRQFVFTCFALILLNSERRVSGVPFSEPPSFKIGEKIGLVTTLSCGTGMFQNKQDSVTRCASAKEDESYQTNGKQRDECSACDPSKSTPYSIKSVLEGDGTVEWRSLPKKRGSVLQEVNITINFPQVFEIQSISVKAGKTPLPAVWALEMTSDVKSDFRGVRYYVANQEDCLKHFGVTRFDNDVDDPVCYSQSERSWTEREDINHLVTSVQLRFLKMWPSVETSDSNLDYYSIGEISIEGRCVCNGHADECSPTDNGLMACHCLHNTCGEQCQYCCDGYARDDSEDCFGRPENISTENTMKATLVQTTSDPRQVSEASNVENVTTSYKVITTTDGSLTPEITVDYTTEENTALLHTTEEAISESSTVESTAVSTSEEITTVPTTPNKNITLSTPHDRSTVTAPAAKNGTITSAPNKSNGLSVTEEASSVSTAEDKTTLSTPEETSTMSLADENARVPIFEVRTTVPTLAKSTTVSPVEGSSVVHTTVQSAIVSPTEKHSTVTSPKENATVSTQEESTTVPTSEGNTTVPTTEKSENVSTPDETTTLTEVIVPTVESITVFTNQRSTTEVTDEEKTTVPTPVRRTTVSTNEQSSDVSSSNVTTTDHTTVESRNVSIREKSTTVLTSAGSSTVSIPEESTAVSTTQEDTTESTPEGSSMVPSTKHVMMVSTPTTYTVSTPDGSTTLTLLVSKEDSSVLTAVKTTSVPTNVKNTTVPTTEEHFSVPTIVENATVPTAVENTTLPTTKEHFSVPITVENATVPTTVENTTVPTIMANTTLPTIVENTTVPTIMANTTVPTTVENTTVPTILVNTTVPTTVENTTVPTIMANTTMPTTVENTTVPTIMANTTVPTTVEYATFPTPVKTTTVPITVKTATLPTTLENTTVPTTVETTTVPTTVENATVPTPVETTNVPTTVENATQRTTVEHTTLPTTLEDAIVSDTTVEKATVPTPVGNAIEPTKLENITVPTTEENTIVPTTVDNATEPTTVGNITVPTTSEHSIVSITVENATVPAPLETTTLPTTVETTTVPTTVETTTVPTTVKTTTVPTTVETTTVSTTVETTTVPTTVKTTTVPTTVETTTVPTTVETTTVSTTVETTTVPTTVKTTTVPTTVKITTVPTTVETTTVPTTVKTTTVPTTVKITTVPTTVETTTVPTTVETTTVPTTVKTTTVPTTVETTTVPTTVETTTVPTTVKITTVPTTPRVLSEEELRKIFGDLPIGVCYCSRFATVTRQCFPTALNEPCICRANFAGTRCEKCAPGFFNYPFCAPCRCNRQGSVTLACDQDTGRCTCKSGVRGRKCDACPSGSFGFPTCSACDCNPSGSYGGGAICDPYTGQCPCRYGARGRQCNKCPAGYYNFPNCQWCGCNPLTTTANICEDSAGGYRCLCKPNYEGLFCGQCRKGYYGFPVCQRCLCSPRGYGSCNELGKCVCNEGYAGIQCDRCANGYYGFPNCRACNCNTFGSYSKQCNYTTGECSCKPNIRGSQCDRCEENMVGFPTCVKCDCNADGTRFLPGFANNMCYGSAKYQCLCKSNVVGRTCDRCMHGFYNFSGNNPLGCTSCSCSLRGTVSGTRNCHTQNGRCDCKNHVIGKKCQNCRDGYHGMKSHDVFGCKACKCDPGGSVGRNCFKHLGNCQCISGVRGKKCDSLYPSRATYFPTLYHTFAELEGAVLASNIRIRVPIGADDDVFPSFSGAGYAIFPPYKEYGVVVHIPKTRKYRVIFHYALRDNLRTSAKVELHPRGSKITSHNFEVQFPPRNPSEQQTKNLRLTVNKRGVYRDFEMEKGAWTVAITSHSSMLLLDYIVFLPEDYYNADLLQNTQSGPCMLRISKPEHCDMYTYYDPKSPSIVTVSGNRAYAHPLRRQAYLFTDTRYYLDEPKLSNMALLGGSQPVIGFDVTVPETGQHIVMVTYLHPERFIHRVFITAGHQRGTMEILPCKYQFLCRQFAMDGNKRPKVFELKARQATEVKIESSASAKIGVSSVTIIPQAKWNTQYVQPQLLCRKVNKTCVPTSYPIPENAIQLVAFSRRTKDKMTSIFNGAVKAFVSYRIIVHYRQPNSLSKKVEQISITGHENPNIPVTFQYCPADSGCRVVVGEEEKLSLQFNRGIFTATIQHERRTHLSYILLVPKDFYSTSLLELQSSDRVTEFLKHCGKGHFYINPVRGRQCREHVFSLTMRFYGEPLQCRCNVLGSRSSVCDEFGGQCLCRTNVVGRRCDRCKLGHSGFPRCRRCGCHEVGSVSPSCTSSGRCRCKPGFGGYKCDRCISSSYYGFPNCKRCACNNLGSLSTFCRSRDGQCQCRRNFQGKKCNECRIGFYDFPSCKKCNCEPAGIKLLPGEKNGCGSVNNTNCRCKDNVLGDKCDSCKPFHFNLQINNPLGCRSCDCDANGTLGSIKTCHEVTGQCFCKSHVTGRQCERCKEGYYSLEGPNAFGCKRCSCNAGGSISPSCNAITGKCSCLPGIGGDQCDRVASNEYYYPTLYQYKIELEDALTTDNGRSAYFRYDESEFPGFSWRGYAVFSQSQTSIYIMVDVPRTSKYQLIFHYLLARYASVTALVKFIPTLNSASFPSGPAREQTLDVRFRTTASWIFAVAQFLVVRDNWGDPQQILLSQGKWKFTMSAPAADLLVDYMVLLPEEYYRPKNLEVHVFSPCKLRGDDSHCSHFAYPSLKQGGFVTIQAEDSSVVGGIRRNRRVTDIPFQGLILTGSRNVMSVRLPSKVQGQFVLLASYFHNSDEEGSLTVVVKTGFENFKAHMSILSCRYRFGCRQVAIDEKHEVRVFTANQNEETTISMTTTLTVALDFISAIPLSKWTQKLMVPEAQCISNGFSCIQSAYFTPTDAVKIEAEDRLNGGDRAPYYIMDRRARLKHLKVGEKTVHVNGRAPSGRYYVIVHFYQPNFLSFLGKVVISGQNAASTLLRFRYCPHVSGCRAIGTSQYREGMSESIYIGRQNDILVSIAIPGDKGVWIDYVLLVPMSAYSPSLLDVKPIDVTQDFIQDCGQHTFFLKDSSSKFCLRSAFTITTRFNGGALSCDCDRLGATKTSCQSFGGQCVCRPNVIGRACDRCRSGYSGFPYCRRLAT